MEKLPSWLVPGHQPRRDKNDPALFDRTSFTKPSRRYRLLDGELRKNVEERPDDSKGPYSLRRKWRLKDFIDRRTGEIVQRYRGGKNFKLVLEPWSPDGLLRIRGRLVASWQPTVVNGGAAPTSNGGRKLVWDDRPPAWATTEPDHGPYVLRAVAELALKGADVSGCNIPGAAEVAARNLEANRLASNDVQSTGPWLDERDAPKSESRLFVSINGEITWHEAPTNLSPGIARYRVELEERKRFGRERAWVSGMPMHVDQGRRAKTSEYRNEQGEYGAEVKVSHDGRVYFGKKGSPLMSHSATESGLKSSTTRRDVRLADGTTKRLEAQKSPTKRKPGPKPKYGFMMSPRLRKVKERCEKRGVPFIIEHHLNAASGLSPPANSRADAVSPSVSAHFYLEDENDTNRASRDGS